MVVECVVFDLDGVLCELDHPARLARLASISGRSAEEIHAAIWASGFEDQSDSGAISEDAYLRGFGERIGFALTEQDWISGRRAGSKPIPETLSMAERLAGEKRLALLTNNGLLLKRTLRSILPEVAALFGPHAYVSAEFGVCKPDPEVYRRLCQKIGAAPETTLMIDDREENIVGAVAAGLQGFLFEGHEALDQELRRLGLA